MHPLIESHRWQLRHLADRYGARSLSVFGSMARDDTNENSDVDLLNRRVDIVTLSALPPSFVNEFLRKQSSFSGRLS